MKNVKEIKCEVKGKEWQNYLDKAFEKKRKEIKVDGFRKGACPKEVFLKKVGKEALYMDASDLALDAAYKKMIKDITEEVACEPSVEISSLDDKGVEFTFTVITRPEVKLGKYKDLGIKKESVKVTKEEIEHEIEHTKSHMMEIVNKENGQVAEGNIAVIDFDGIVDGEPLEGGSGKDYELEIGSGQFIPGFETGLIGAEIGEERELNLKFPEDYHENLKGKDVIFKVRVNAIKEKIAPEMNADFFEDLGIEGVNSVETLEAHIKESIKHEKEHKAEDEYINKVLETACNNMEVEINPEIIENEVNTMVNEYRRDMQRNGIELEQYLGYMGMTIDSLKETVKPQAEARVKTRYLLEEIVKAEKIEPTKEDIKAEKEKLAEYYGIDAKDLNEEMVEYSVKMTKAMDIVKNS